MNNVDQLTDSISDNLLKIIEKHSTQTSELFLFILLIHLQVLPRRMDWKQLPRENHSGLWSSL